MKVRGDFWGFSNEHDWLDIRCFSGCFVGSGLYNRPENIGEGIAA